MTADARRQTPPDDSHIGSFREDGPWTVEPDNIRWIGDVASIRERVVAEAPLLTRRSGLPPISRVAVSSVRIGGALALWALRDRRRGGQASRGGLSRRLRQAFERLGPTYIKLGQIISSGEGIFPDEVVEQFKLCRDKVPPEPFDVVRRVVEDDLGRPLAAVFSEFEEQPVAAASIAQVHRATLRTGQRVAVKVQRPTVSSRVRQDIAAMAWVAPHLVGRIPVAALANPPALVELFCETILEELDFRIEAANMLDVARVLAETDQRAIVVPRPHPELVSRRVLVMELLEGFALEDVEGMRRAGIDTSVLLRAGVTAFMEGAMIFGVFHGDLHGGNLFVLPDGRIALLDYGITGRLTEPGRIAFLRLLVAATTGDVDGQLKALRDLGALPPDTDVAALIRDLGLDRPPQDVTSMGSEELVAELRGLVKHLLEYGARMPKVLMLFVKNMVFLDGAIALLAPEIDLVSEIGEIFGYFMTKHGEQIARDVGADSSQLRVDVDGWKAMIGIDADGVSYRDLQERRELIRSRFDRRARRGGV